MHRGIAATISIVVFFGATLCPASAKPRPSAYVVDPGLIIGSINGPTTVVVAGNPFVTPWRVVTNQVSTAGSVPPTQLGPSLNGQSPPSPVGGGPPPSGNGQPGQQANGSSISIKFVPLSSGARAGQKTCLEKDGKTVHECADLLRDRVKYTNETFAQPAYYNVCAAQIEYKALQDHADAILNGTDPIFLMPLASGGRPKLELRTEDGRKDAALTIGSQLLASTATTEPPCRETTDAAKEVHRRALFATVTSAIAAINRIPPFPTQDVVDEIAESNQIRGVIKQNIAKGLNTDGSNDVAAELDAIDATLQPISATGIMAVTYATAAAQLTSLQSTVLANVTIDKFYKIYPEDCTGVFSGGRSTTLTVVRNETTSNSVVITCQTRAFASAGYAFSQLPQRDFTAVPTNGALPQAPPGAPPPAAATIQQTTFSDTRPMPVVLLNVRWTAEEMGDNGYYASFGVSVNSSPTSTTIDYLLGASYSLSRSLIFTIGGTLAPTNELSPGYAPGDPIALNGRPPTITRLRAALFLAITYGAH